MNVCDNVIPKSITLKCERCKMMVHGWTEEWKGWKSVVTSVFYKQ